MSMFNDVDILLGKGSRSNLHPGNKAFRSEVKLHHEQYDNERDGRKYLIAQTIVHKLLARGARFLRKDEPTGIWVEVDIKSAYRKTQQTLRDGAVKRREERQKERTASPKRKNDHALCTFRPMNATSSLFQVESGAKNSLFERRFSTPFVVSSSSASVQPIPPPPLQRQNSLENCLVFSSISSTTEISTAIFDSVSACRAAPRPTPVALPNPASSAQTSPLGSPTSTTQPIANTNKTTASFLTKGPKNVEIDNDEALREYLRCFGGEFDDGRPVSV